MDTIKEPAQAHQTLQKGRMQKLHLLTFFLLTQTVAASTKPQEYASLKNEITCITLDTHSIIPRIQFYLSDDVMKQLETDNNRALFMQVKEKRDKALHKATQIVQSFETLNTLSKNPANTWDEKIEHANNCLTSIADRFATIGELLQEINETPDAPKMPNPQFPNAYNQEYLKKLLPEIERLLTTCIDANIDGEIACVRGLTSLSIEIPHLTHSMDPEWKVNAHQVFKDAPYVIFAVKKLLLAKPNN